MVDIIKFPEPLQEFEHTSYTEGVDCESIGVSMLDRRIGMSRLNDNEFIIITPNDEQVFSRDALSEFLWLAAYLIDGDQKRMPEGEVIACD